MLYNSLRKQTEKMNVQSEQDVPNYLALSECVARYSFSRISVTSDKSRFPNPLINIFSRIQETLANALSGYIQDNVL